MEERLAIGRPHARRLEIVDVPFLQAIYIEPDALTVLADFDLGDRRRRRIDLRAAVSRLVDVSEGLEFIRVRLGGNGSVDPLREGQLKAIRLGPHLMDLERGFAGPDEPLDRERFVPARAPAATRPADEQ